VLELKLKVA